MMKKVTVVLIALLVSYTTIQAQSWGQIGSDFNGEEGLDHYGWSVSLSADGSIMAIGAKDNNGTADLAGHVRIFENKDGVWSQVGADIDGQAVKDYFGYSVSLSADGSTLAIGASGNGGYIRIYRRVADAWEQIGVDIVNETTYEGGIGKSVSLSADGTRVAFGAPESGEPLFSMFKGLARVYQLSATDTWEKIGEDIDGETKGDFCGNSVSLSGDGSTVAVGAYFNSGAGDEAGHVRIFKLGSTNTWEQVGVDIDGEAEGNKFGKSVSINTDGSIVAIGSTGDKDGYVKVYQLAANTWGQLGTTIKGEAAKDYFGTSVCLTPDGSNLAIGATGNDGAGDGAGNVRVYHRVADAWEQIAGDIDGEAYGDNSGSSVSLSADGSIVAIGAPYNDGGGSSSGHVRVYKLLLSQTITFDALETKTYGDASFTVSATGGVTGNPVIFTSSDENIATCTGTNGEIITIINADSCIIYAKQAGNDEYAAAQAEQRLYVNKYAVTVTVDSLQTKVYGEVDPVFTYTATALLNTDEYTGTLSKEAGENVGTYAIEQNDLTAGANYELTFVRDSFKITTMPVTVTVDAGQTKVYGEEDPTFTYTATTLLNADKYTGTLSKEAGEDAGTYAIEQNNLTAGLNYEITFVSDNFEITKATPLVAWSNPADIYYETALGETQLNATASIEGAFEYTPASGTVLEIGDNQKLSTVFTPTDATNYNVVNAEVLINVLKKTSVESLSAQNISIYPNPTSSMLNFDFANNTIQKINIADLTGKMIIEISDIKQKEMIDLSNFETGIYIISIQIDNKIVTTKIVKE